MRRILLFCSAILFVSFISCRNSEKKSGETDKTEKQAQEKMASPSAKKAGILQKIAVANGLENWDEIEKAEFAFNVARDSSHFKRSWKWWPQTGKVVMMADTDTVRYDRDEQLNEKEMKADQAFVNDTYWLLFPYQLVWSEGFKHSVEKNVKSPMAGKKMSRVTIKFQNGGYTPGDMYKIYVDDEYMIREWSYHPDGQRKPAIISTWEGYEKQNGITYATNHVFKKGGTRIYFSGVVFK